MDKVQTTLAVVSETEFDSEVLAHPGVVLVDFYAEWCGPCHMLAPILKQVAEERSGEAKIVKVDIDQSPNLANRYRIRGVPTLLVFKQGGVVDQAVGAQPKAALNSMIDRNL